jgi:hypothetical protein
VGLDSTIILILNSSAEDQYHYADDVQVVVTKYATPGRVHTYNVCLQLATRVNLEAGHCRTWFGASLARGGKNGLRQSTSKLSYH